MDVVNFLNTYFDEETANRFSKRYQDLFFEDLKAEYENFLKHGDAFDIVQPEQIFTPELRKVLLVEKKHSQIAIGHEIVLINLESRAKKRNLMCFYKAMKEGNQEELQKVLERDNEGQLHEIVKKMETKRV